MKRALFAAVLFCVGLTCLSQSDAAFIGPRRALLIGKKVVAPSYVGPGDVISGASAFWGLRAYSAATAGSNAADVRCVTAAKTVTIKTLTSGNFDVASLTAACPADTYFLSKLYNQTNPGTADMVQATTASQPGLALNCLNTSLPCTTFSGSQGMAAALASIPSPYSYVAVGERTGSTTSFGVILDTFLDGGSSGTSFLYANSANHVRFSVGNGASFIATANDNAWHAYAATLSGTTGTIVVDNTATTGTVSNAATTNNAFIGTRNDGAVGVPSRGAEFAIYPSALNSTQYGNLCHNQYLYWATSTSC